MRAVDEFDDKRGPKFSTHGSWWSRLRAQRTALAAVVGLSLVVACSEGGESAGASRGTFGACCATGADCASGVCSADHRACTVACTTDDDCPPEPKSGKADCSNDGVCQAESAGDPCQGPSSSGGSTGAGGSLSAGGSASGGSPSSGGSPATGGASAGGSPGAGGRTGGTIGIGDPCSSDDACASGICYRPGGPPGFCTASCSVSFDTACFGIGQSGDNSAGEIVYCMPFATGGRCYPGCVNSRTCSPYAGTVCAAVEDIAGYNGSVCVERL